MRQLKGPQAESVPANIRKESNEALSQKTQVHKPSEHYLTAQKHGNQIELCFAYLLHQYKNCMT